MLHSPPPDPSIRAAAAPLPPGFDASHDPALLTPAARDALDSILRRIRSRPDFPALSKAIERIGELTSSDDERIDKLAEAILQDVSLTSRVLRLVNSSLYRGSGLEPIGTIGHAVMLLGVKAVRSLALSVTLYEQISDSDAAARLRVEYVRALLGGAIARTLAIDLGIDPEEAWLCGMFLRLGQIVVLYHLPDEVDDIARTVRRRQIPEDLAARLVLGIGLDQVGMAVAREWGFPESVVISMHGPNPGQPVPHAISRDTRLRVLASLCAELIDAFACDDPHARDAALERLGRRYAPATRIGATRAREALTTAAAEVRAVAEAVGIVLADMSLGRRILSLADPHAYPDPGDGTAARASGASPAGAKSGAKPADHDASAQADSARHAQETLAFGLADMSRALADEQSLSDVMRLVVDVLHRALELQRVVFALRDTGANAIVGRYGVGAGLPELLAAFRVPLVQSGDLFSATVLKGADLLIADAATPNVANHLPAWHGRFEAGSFLMLPLTIRTGTVGLLYGDRANALQSPPPAQVQSLVRAIRNQLVLALQRGH